MRLAGRRRVEFDPTERAALDAMRGGVFTPAALARGALEGLRQIGLTLSPAAARLRARSSSWPQPVTAIRWTWRPQAASRTRRARSWPLICGRPRSSSATSGWMRSASSNAVRPS